MAQKTNGKVDLVEQLKSNPELLKALLREISGNRKTQREKEISEAAEILGQRSITAEIAGFPIICYAKKFQSGRYGYYGNGKIDLNGYRFQVSLNIVRIEK